MKSTQRMITCKEIDAYIEYMDDHPSWINEDRRLLIKNIVRPTLARDDVFFDEKKYKNCIKYCEKNYYAFFPYEKFIAAFMFMFYKRDDEPVFPEFFIMEGRGNGKDGFMVPIANFLQTPLNGVTNYNIELVANSEQQIKDTFKVAYDKITESSKLSPLFRTTKEEIVNVTTGSVLRYNTAGSKTKDGKRPGCVFLNEYHAYENYDNVSVYESAAGKVAQFREIIITTQGTVRDGPLDDMLTTCRSILDTGENPLGIFPFICRLDSESEVDNEDLWHKANPSMEYMPILQKAIKRNYLEMKRIPTKKPEFMTKRMNLPAQKESMAVTSWDNILKCCYEDAERRILRKTADTTGNLGIIGIDYADFRDFASAGILTKDDKGNYIWRQHTWICAQSPFLDGVKFPIENAGQDGFSDFEVVDAPVIPITAICDWCLKTMGKYRVQKITMDTYRYTMLKEIFEQNGISTETKDNPQGLIRLVRRIRSASGMIAPTIEKLFNEGKIDYGDSAIMRWYTNNTCINIDGNGNYQYQKIEAVRRKNDGFMAFVVAMFSSDLLKEKIVYV